MQAETRPGQLIASCRGGNGQGREPAIVATRRRAEDMAKMEAPSLRMTSCCSMFIPKYTPSDANSRFVLHFVRRADQPGPLPERREWPPQRPGHAF